MGYDTVSLYKIPKPLQMAFSDHSQGRLHLK